MGARLMNINDHDRFCRASSPGKGISSFQLLEDLVFQSFFGDLVWTHQAFSENTCQKRPLFVGFASDSISTDAELRLLPFLLEVVTVLWLPGLDDESRLNAPGLFFGHPFFCLRRWSICISASLGLDKVLEKRRRFLELLMISLVSGSCSVCSHWIANCLTATRWLVHGIGGCFGHPVPAGRGCP